MHHMFHLSTSCRAGPSQRPELRPWLPLDIAVSFRSTGSQVEPQADGRGSDGPGQRPSASQYFRGPAAASKAASAERSLRRIRIGTTTFVLFVLAPITPLDRRHSVARMLHG